MEERNAVLKSEGARGARMTYNMRKEKKGNMSFLEDMGKWTLVWTKPHPSVQILTLSISKVLGWVKGGCAMEVHAASTGTRYFLPWWSYPNSSAWPRVQGPHGGRDPPPIFSRRTVDEGWKYPVCACPQMPGRLRSLQVGLLSLFSSLGWCVNLEVPPRYLLAGLAPVHGSGLVVCYFPACPL